MITDKEQFRHNLNILISILNINIAKLCQHTNKALFSSVILQKQTGECF